MPTHEPTGTAGPSLSSCSMRIRRRGISLVVIWSDYINGVSKMQLILGLWILFYLRWEKIRQGSPKKSTPLRAPPSRAVLPSISSFMRVDGGIVFARVDGPGEFSKTQQTTIPRVGEPPTIRVGSAAPALLPLDFGVHLAVLMLPCA